MRQHTRVFHFFSQLFVVFLAQTCRLTHRSFIALFELDSLAHCTIFIVKKRQEKNRMKTNKHKTKQNECGMREKNTNTVWKIGHDDRTQCNWVSILRFANNTFHLYAIRLNELLLLRPTDWGNRRHTKQIQRKKKKKIGRKKRFIHDDNNENWVSKWYYRMTRHRKSVKNFSRQRFFSASSCGFFVFCVGRTRISHIAIIQTQ